MPTLFANPFLKIKSSHSSMASPCLRRIRRAALSRLFHGRLSGAPYKHRRPCGKPNGCRIGKPYHIPQKAATPGHLLLHLIPLSLFSSPAPLCNLQIRPCLPSPPLTAPLLSLLLLIDTPLSALSRCFPAAFRCFPAAFPLLPAAFPLPYLPFTSCGAPLSPLSRNLKTLPLPAFSSWCLPEAVSHCLASATFPPPL